jgi:SAM-dependent methyltransferase
VHDSVAAHYSRPRLLEQIEQALRESGKDPARLRVADLAPVDHFHTRGLQATLELARLAGAHAGDRVLDLGGGIGGPARVLAAQFGCTVTVVDLTPDYCRTGEALTAWTGLADRVRFVVGDATDPPVEPASFDLVWTQHSSMNIADKERLYAAAFRALRVGGRLALHDIMAGPRQPIRFPVPWAATPDLSHLRSAEAMREAILGAGFRMREWREVTPPTLVWVRERLAAGGAGPLGVHLHLGERFRPAFENMALNLEEGRLRVVEALFERPG